MKTHVVCIGLATSDIVFDVERLPSSAGKHYAKALHQVGGGPASNAAVTVSRLGGRASFVGCLGDDPGGERILADLAASGVATDHVQFIPDTSSSTSAVMVDEHGERMIVNFFDPRLLTGDIDSTPFADADAVLADTRWLAGAEVALAAAAARGVPGVIDYDMAPTHLENLPDDAPALAAASHIAFSAPGLAGRTGTDDPSEGLRRASELTDAWVAVTLGEHGVRWLDEGIERHLPAFEVTAMDTLGAGDVFHGALALELGRGAAEAEAVRVASAAAAIKCSRPSGKQAIPDAAELQTFLTDHNEQGR